MTISDLLNRRVRARPDYDEGEDVYSQASLSEENDHHPIESDSDEASDDLPDDATDMSDDESDDQDEGGDEDVDQSSSEAQDSDSSKDNVQASLSNISFGALAKAQASLGPKTKHGTKAFSSAGKPEKSEKTSSPLDNIRARIQEAREQKRKALSKAKDANKPSRSSKHAPAVQTSRFAVSRKRIVVEPSEVTKYRDPRFDPTVVGRHTSDAASKNYSFLDDYRAAELKELKESLRKTRDLQQREAIQRNIRSATDRLRTSENNKREKEVLAEHKKREKQLIREGKKATPYYLKKSELKKQVLLKKYESMNSKDRAKALERRRKKMASKEIKEMPMERRGLGGGGAGQGHDGARKRRRLD